MHRSVYVRIPVEPMGKPRMVKSDSWKKRPCVLRYWRYKDVIASSVSHFDLSFCAEVSMKFYMGIPKSWSKKKKEEMKGKPHQQKVDIDNVIKGVFDRDWETEIKM